MTMLNFKKLAYIEWYDHSGGHAGSWAPLEDAVAGKPLLMRSVGWVIKETKEFVTIVPHVDEENRNVIGDQCIHKKLIHKRVKVLVKI